MTRRLTLAAAMLAALMPLTAQNRGPGAGRGSRIDFLAGYLSLTDAQKDQAKTIFEAAGAAAATLSGTLESARDALRAAIKANQSEGELDRLAAAAGAVQGQLEAIHAKAEAKFYALLTAGQKTKYDELGARGGGPGGGGPMRGFRRG